MDTNVSSSVADNSIRLARKYVVENNFGRAFPHYLVSLKLRPDWKPILKTEFSTALCKLGLILEGKNRLSDLFQCYEQAIEIFPDNEIILNNLGSHLFRCHSLKEATYYFRQSLAVNPNFIRARYNLDNVSNSAVENWHFRMLNDYHRNKAFQTAILKKIADGFDRVLDIGTGTGILSLFCLEGKAKEVYACDSSRVMFEIAKEVLHCNQASKFVKLTNKHSSQLVIPSDIPERVSLVVTETVDSGLLGENILITLSHAWSNLLLQPVPDSAGGKCDGKFGFVIPSRARLYLTGIECNVLSSCQPSDIGKNLLRVSEFLTLRNCDNYDTQDLNRVKYRCLTKTEILSEINFNDPDYIKSVLNGRQDKEFVLRCTESGRLDCFALWFDLVLDEDITINTGPHSVGNEAWEQAVFPVPKSFAVSKNQEISVRMSFAGGKLSIGLNESNENRNLQPSASALKTLQNTKLMATLEDVKNKLSTAYNRSIRILDWFPFPVFGMNFMIERANEFTDELVCFVTSETDQKLIRIIAKKYGLEDRVTVEVDTDAEQHFQSMMESRKFDIIVLNLVEITGELKENCASQLTSLRNLLNPGGILLPEKVTIVGQFMHSDWLVKASRVVDDDVTCGYRIGKFINVYQVRHFIDMDLGTDKVPVSESFELAVVDGQDLILEKIIPCFSNCHPISAMFYWFKLEFMTGLEEIETNDETSTFRQCAFLLPHLVTGRELKCRIVCSDGLFNVEFPDTQNE